MLGLELPPSADTPLSPSAVCVYAEMWLPRCVDLGCATLSWSRIHSGSCWGDLRGIECPLKPHTAWEPDGNPTFQPGLDFGSSSRPRFGRCLWNSHLCPWPSARCQQPDPDTPHTGKKMLHHLILFSLLCSRQPQGQIPFFFQCLISGNCLPAIV